jgi:UDP-N-acetylmuramoylalanine--D-glutamate ligase
LSRGVSTLGGRLYDALTGRAELVLDLASAVTLPGRHNAQNAAAAYAACRGLGLPARDIANGIATFPGLEHRLELAGTIEGVRFINDSKATNADATAQALAVYKRIHWIAGGKAKEGGIETLAPYFPRIAKAYLIGEAAPLFTVALNGKVPSMQCGTMDKAVAQAFKDARASRDSEAVVLLSPACASFDQFKDFEERGEHFKTLVAALDGVMRERANA